MYKFKDAQYEFQAFDDAKFPVQPFVFRLKFYPEWRDFDTLPNNATYSNEKTNEELHMNINFYGCPLIRDPSDPVVIQVKRESKC